jgi:uncharacterized protein (TIGR02996 family)
MSLEYARLLALQYKLFTEKVAGKNVDRVVRPDRTWAEAQNEGERESTAPSPSVESRFNQSDVRPHNSPRKGGGLVPVDKDVQVITPKFTVHKGKLGKLRSNKALMAKLNELTAANSNDRGGPLVKYGMFDSVARAASKNWPPVNSPKATLRKDDPEVKFKEYDVKRPRTPVVEDTKSLPDLTVFKTKRPNKIEANKLLAPKAVHPSLHATKIAGDLIHLRDKFGPYDKPTKDLATQALKRQGGTGVFTQLAKRLRDIFISPTEGDSSVMKQIPEKDREHYREHANQIHQDYNWNRISDSLDLDDHVRSFVEKAFNDDKYGHKGADGKTNAFKDYAAANSHFRAAHNFFGGGAEKRHAKYGTAGLHKAFWNSLKKHVATKMKGPGASVKISEGALGKLTEKHLQDSLFRLASQEQNKADIQKAKVEEKKSDPRFYVNPHEYPAFIEKDGEQVPRPNARSTQFKRVSYDSVYCAALKYGLFEKVKGFLSPSSVERDRSSLTLPPVAPSKRVTITPKGNEPGVNMFTGNTVRDVEKKDPAVKRRKEFDGIVYNATMPGFGGIHPKHYKSAHIEQAAVSKALEDLAQGDFPVTHAKVAEHISTIRQMLKSKEDRATLRPHMDNYVQLASSLASKYPNTGETPLLRSVTKGNRPSNPDVDQLAEAVKPLVTAANERISGRNKSIAEAAGNEYFHTDALPASPELQSQIEKVPDRSFGWGKGEASSADTPEEFPDFDLDLPDMGTNKDLQEIEDTPKLQTPDEMLAAAQARLAKIKDTSKVPLAKRKSGGQFKSLLKNYGIDTPTETPTVTKEKGIPLAKGKVKKLPPIRQSRFKPEEYFNDAELLKYARALRYGAAEDEAGFHEAMANNIEDCTTPLVYADWLQDQGKEHHASIIREHPESFQESHFDLDEMFPEMQQDLKNHPTLITVGKTNGLYTPILRLNSKAKGDEGNIFEWHGKPRTKEDIVPFLKNLHKEGAKVSSQIPSDIVLDVSKFNRSRKPLRYGANDEAGFHQSMIENPEEKTNALVYADYLQDQGKESHADVIRNHEGNKHGTGAVVHDIDDWTANKFKDGDIKPGDTYVKLLGGLSSAPKHTVLLGQRTHNGNHIIKWRYPLPVSHAADLAKKLVAEGAKVFPSRETQNALASTDTKEKPEQHARAGAGGLIVNYGDVAGKYKPGGQFVETLGTETTAASAPKKKSKRKGLRLKLKKWIANKGFSSFS